MTLRLCSMADTYTLLHNHRYVNKEPEMAQLVCLTSALSPLWPELPGLEPYRQVKCNGETHLWDCAVGALQTRSLMVKSSVGGGPGWPARLRGDLIG